MHLRRIERWIGVVRLIAVPFAIFQVALSSGYPNGYEAAAWATTGIFAVGAAGLFLLGRLDLSDRGTFVLNVVAQLFDTAVVSAYVVIYSFERGTLVPETLFLPLVEGCVRFAVVGGVVVALASGPVMVAFEKLHGDRLNEAFRWDFVTLHVGIELLLALIVGRLVRSLGSESLEARALAGEAVVLRDELVRRVDVLDAANRCARALSSSLELHEAFGSFIRELRGLVPFDRVAIVLAEGQRARVIATGGMGSEAAFPAGSDWPLDDSITAEVLEGRAVVQRDLEEEAKGDVAALVELGLRSRLGAPLLVGAQAIGMLSLSRREVDSFTPSEVELVTLLGRLVGTTVQNIRAYEAERRTVEELRRLSALRADFVSLVSHELRSPMAAVIGAARTLQERWRELSPQQRSSFLALISDETSRLATLIGDVLDTSRIEAGTFSYSFTDVDVGELVRETVATIGLGQDEVAVVARSPDAVPRVRADRERLKQVLVNLVENAVKYSRAGDQVEVSTWAENGRVHVAVEDHGPGIPREYHGLIFEKFGRANVGGGKPGTGLGLFIARSISEAHGGRLGVRSAPGQGATFTLELPLG
jgi:signal transduction histidine kinase